ncbi:glycopeptide [Dendrothele bispora CBS 962.96]|uniref:Glycopeptide n=1 Tax=Dendrothele bispora (strain CBS 962.96) TaxID=1314807 RepID=A0A4S8L8M0_DENBC|nr:glycopeptide [Dendrothele bispora CBS 962.96]
MFSFKSLSLFGVITYVYAETHTIVFDNQCGFGTPTLIQGSDVLGTGNGPFTFNEPLNFAIAYRTIGTCGFHGEGCTLIETTLRNPTCPGCGSGTDINLIPPKIFLLILYFSYFNGCDGVKRNCKFANCVEAFHTPDDGGIQTVCQADDVNLRITFCEKD